MKIIAAEVYLVLSIVLIVFQAGLAFGMPWGAASMGGKFPGKYPPGMRIVAFVNILIILAFLVIVMAKAALYFHGIRPFANYAIWFCAVFFGIGTILNTITPSKIERIWAPVALVQFICCLILAFSE